MHLPPTYLDTTLTASSGATQTRVLADNHPSTYRNHTLHSHILKITGSSLHLSAVHAAAPPCFLSVQYQYTPKSCQATTQSFSTYATYKIAALCVFFRCQQVMTDPYPFIQRSHLYSFKRDQRLTGIIPPSFSSTEWQEEAVFYPMLCHCFSPSSSIPLDCTLMSHRAAPAPMC